MVYFYEVPKYLRMNTNTVISISEAFFSLTSPIGYDIFLSGGVAHCASPPSQTWPLEKSGGRGIYFIGKH